MPGPAVDAINIVLESIAPEFGYDPADPQYLIRFRNPVFSFFTAERLLMTYSNLGTDGVRADVQQLRGAGIL